MPQPFAPGVGGGNAESIARPSDDLSRALEFIAQLAGQLSFLPASQEPRLPKRSGPRQFLEVLRIDPPDHVTNMIKAAADPTRNTVQGQGWNMS